MKVSKDYIMREIAGECILVPVGAAAAKFNGLVTMNEVGKYIVELLAEEHTVQELVEKITEKYDVEAQTALTDVEAFLEQLREVGALVEERS